MGLVVWCTLGAGTGHMWVESGPHGAGAALSGPRRWQAATTPCFAHTSILLGMRLWGQAALHVLRRRDGVVPTVAAGGCAGVRIVSDLGCVAQPLGGRLSCLGGAGGKAGGGKMIDGASAIVCIACYNMLQRCHCLALVAVLRIGVCVVLCALLACCAC